MELRTGTQVNAEIRLGRPLAQGSQGSLWEAQHTELGRVAVKFMSDEAAAKDKGALERFFREAEACARLDTAHVARLYGHGVLEGLPYLVLELLDGESLEARLERERKLPIVDVARIVVHVARALAIAHARGIVHRDVKPANIFLSRAGEQEVVKLIDFGIALRSEDKRHRLTNLGVVMGSPEYMSPEQVSASTVGPSYDLWALAVVAYKALTGRAPFTGPNLGAVFSAILDGDLAPPSRHAPELPPALDRWFRKALDRGSDHRFADANELAASFTRAAGLRRRSRPLALTAIVVAVAVAAGLLVGFFLARGMLG